MELEKERLLELKRFKELEWTERRRANKEQKEQLRKEKQTRLDKAAVATITARTKGWSMKEKDKDYTGTGTSSPKRKKNWDPPTTPSKRLRNAGQVDSTIPANRTTLTAPRSQIQAKIAIFENGSKEGGPQKAPPTKKALSIRTKKWVKKKNGMFGWISCIVPSQGEVKNPPQFQKGGGVITVQKVKGIRSADRQSARLE